MSTISEVLNGLKRQIKINAEPIAYRHSEKYISELSSNNHDIVTRYLETRQ
jgi:hypothetical protein